MWKIYNPKEMKFNGINGPGIAKAICFLLTIYRAQVYEIQKIRE